MAEWPPPVIMTTCSRLEAIASSTAYWMVGLSSSGRTYFDWALVTGRNRVASPAPGKMARRTVALVVGELYGGGRGEGGPDPGSGTRAPARGAGGAGRARLRPAPLLSQVERELLQPRVVHHHPGPADLAVPAPDPRPLACGQKVGIIA